MRSLRAALLCTNCHTGSLRSPTTCCATAGSRRIGGGLVAAPVRNGRSVGQRYGRCSAASAYHIMLLYSYHTLVGQRYGRCSAASAYHIMPLYSYPILVGQRYGRCSAASAYHTMLLYMYPTLVATVRQVLGGLGVSYYAFI
jgi:hypothetical protein